ncbi:hypothetical protein C8A00DRAFT_46525 [Chaetomidium leptoderma]|uniref:Uncharacterized protein n=1 Tax=Chaetomidium leptoderma TaxID=669021 RepID=A0AAN6VEG2_9PEZI|nr:hypothetical protein C8A00DRAFT_46525 [Chaetomidium leptoderma]
MSKIAWRIAHAFTKGRKSAPAEFREVENQLYSLSAALTAFKDVCGTDIAAITIDPAELPVRFQKEERDGVQTVSGILDSCGETLKHLETIVNNYEVVAAPGDPTKSRLRHWRAELVENYKKVAWTTEAGDLAALRSQLMVHTNSLDLVLGIIVSSRTSRIEDSLRENSSMLHEIHSWWAQNLKDVAAIASAPVHQDSSIGLQRATRPISFGVYLIAGGVSQILCPEACLHDDWKETGSSQLLVCMGTHAKETAGPTPGQCRVENIGLNWCLPGNAGSWTLFKALDRSTSQMVSIVIKNVRVSDILEFEHSFIRPLAEAKAEAMLKQGTTNQLVHMSSDVQHVRTLNLQSDLSGFHRLLNAVTFRVGHRNLSKANVDGLSLLNYRELDRQSLRSMDSALDRAELSIYYGSEGIGEASDIAKSIVHAANKLHERLEEMRMELFVTSLQYPRRDEIVALHLQATEVQCEVAIISDAELLITRNQQGQYRLIVASRNRCTVLSQVWTGKRNVYHYPNGFRFPSFRNANAERMFELGRSALLQGA